MYKGHEEVYENVKREVHKLEDKAKGDKNFFIGLEQLKGFFGGSQSQNTSFLNRRVMHHILRNYMKREIMESSQVKKHILYLQAAKVYALRCRSQILAERNQCD